MDKLTLLLSFDRKRKKSAYKSFSQQLMLDKHGLTHDVPEHQLLYLGTLDKQAHKSEFLANLTKLHRIV